MYQELAESCRPKLMPEIIVAVARIFKEIFGDEGRDEAVRFFKEICYTLERGGSEEEINRRIGEKLPVPEGVGGADYQYRSKVVGDVQSAFRVSLIGIYTGPIPRPFCPLSKNVRYSVRVEPANRIDLFLQKLGM